MKYYCEACNENVFDYIPVTFHIQNGKEDKTYQKFLSFYNEKAALIQEQDQQLQNYPDLLKKKNKNIWIIKPGEVTNRGKGITVCENINEINSIISAKEIHNNGKSKTYIIQEYIDKPLLYQKRKFDIRCFILLTSVNGINKGTSSKEFNTKNLQNRMIHLTNDAVQKKGDDYGKYENGNKVSFTDFAKYIETKCTDIKLNFQTEIYPRIKSLATKIIRAVFSNIDPQHFHNTFELFGLDFMIDYQGKVYLIEANTNPCLEMSSPLLARLIPLVLENTFRIAVDPLFPPPEFSLWPISKKQYIPDNPLENNKFDLVFDEIIHGPELKIILQKQKYKRHKLKDMIHEIKEEDSEGVFSDEDN